MVTHDTQENENQIVLQQAIQKKSTEQQTSFQDNREDTVTQRKIQDAANNSNRTVQLQTMQEIADNSERVAQLQVMQEIADNSERTTPFGVIQQKASNKSQAAAVQTKENNTGLPDNLKSGIENLSGFSMDDVQVHYNSDKPAKLQAEAYAQGTDIYIAAGQEQHLPHEAWHVVQQKQGRVKPTVDVNGAPVNDNNGLEKEADVMGEKAAQSGGAESTTQLKAAKNNTIQRKGEAFTGDYDRYDKTEDRFDFFRGENNLGQGFSEGIWLGDTYGVGGRAWWKLWLGKKEQLNPGKPVYFDEDNYQDGDDKTEVYVKGTNDEAPARDIGVYTSDYFFQQQGVLNQRIAYSDFPNKSVHDKTGELQVGDNIRFVSKQSIIPLNTFGEEYTMVHSENENKGAWVIVADLDFEVTPDMYVNGASAPAALPDIPSDTFVEFAAHKLAYGGKASALAASEILESNGYAADATIAFNGPAGFQVTGLFPYAGSNVKPILAIRGTASMRGVAADLHPGGVGKGQFNENRDLIEAIFSMAESSNNQFVVTGHSLGGAMAQRTAMEFPGRTARLVTFQSPKVAGDNDKSNNAINIINKGGEESNIQHYTAKGDVVDWTGFLSNHLGGNVEEIDTGRWTPTAHTDFVHGDMENEEDIIEAFGSIEEYERVTGKTVRR